MHTNFRVKMGDQEEQEDELLAVSEILPPGTFRVQRGQTSTPHRGSIEVYRLGHLHFLEAHSETLTRAKLKFIGWDIYSY